MELPYDEEVRLAVTGWSGTRQWLSLAQNPEARGHFCFKPSSPALDNSLFDYSSHAGVRLEPPQKWMGGWFFHFLLGRCCPSVVVGLYIGLVNDG